MTLSMLIPFPHSTKKNTIFPLMALSLSNPDNYDTTSVKGHVVIARNSLTWANHLNADLVNWNMYHHLNFNLHIVYAKKYHL